MKISFNKLKNKETVLKIKAFQFNGETIEVKQYLPVNDKLNLISAVLQQVAQNEYPFINPIQMDVYSTLEIIYAYVPDIEFTEEEKANPAELYDELEQQGIPNLVISAIPQAEYEFLIEGIEKTISAYYAYRNSAKGIIEDITTDYKDLDLDATNLRDKIADPNSLNLLKDVMQKLG